MYGRKYGTPKYFKGVVSKSKSQTTTVYFYIFLTDYRSFTQKRGNKLVLKMMHRAEGGQKVRLLTVC